MTDMHVRDALARDLPTVAEIYGHEAVNGHATFDDEPRPMSAWEERLRSETDHLLVAEHDGTVIGWTTSSTFRPKPAYRHTRESAVYVAPGHQGLGTGRALYDALLALLAGEGVHLVVAAVALPNPASLALHRACGFEEVGTMREVGRKFDRWIDLVWLQRRLG